MDSDRLEELYEKCRALIEVILEERIDEDDRFALVWILSDYFKELGKVIGTVSKK